MSADPANQTPCTLQRVGNGDRSAIAECLQYYGGLVWSIARRLSPNKEDAEDAVQDIFFDLWRNAGRFDPEQGSEKVFITMIARRRLIDRLRAHERRALVESLPDDITALADRTVVDERLAAEISYDAAIAAKALTTLSNEQQIVLKLSILLGLSHSEIAHATRLPLGTVKTHIRRGLLQIRKLMSQAVTAEQGTPSHPDTKDAQAASAPAQGTQHVKEKSS